MHAHRALPFVVAAALAAAVSSCDCGGDQPTDDHEPYTTAALEGAPAEADGVAVDAGATALMPIDEGTPGRIGSACETADDCSGGGTCLLGAFARGTCSQACEATCPLDQGAREGVCASRDQLPDDASVLASGGACLSTCDYGRFPEDGCREGYGCVPLDRRGRGGSLAYACMPGVPMEKTPCMEELVARGASFEPLAKQDEAPRFLEGARCEIEDAVLLHTPVHGVVFKNGDGKETPSIIASCAMAAALVEAVVEWKAQGVAKVVHFGTYSCRKIAGKPRLSRHAGGDAIDVGGFVMSDGRTISVVRDWRKGESGKLLTDVVANAKSQGPWSTIITPDDNWDHRDHLHLDLKGSGPSVANRITRLAKE